MKEKQEIEEEAKKNSTPKSSPPEQCTPPKVTSIPYIIPEIKK